MDSASHTPRHDDQQRPAVPNPVAARGAYANTQSSSGDSGREAPTAATDSPTLPVGRDQDTVVSASNRSDLSRYARLARQINQSRTGKGPPLASGPSAIHDISRGAVRSQEASLSLDAPGQELPGASTPGSWLRWTPVWLSSAVVHATLLLTLAILTFHPGQYSPKQLVVSMPEVPDVTLESVDEFELSEVTRERVTDVVVTDLQLPQAIDLAAPDVLAPNLDALQWDHGDMLQQQRRAALRIDPLDSLNQPASGEGAQFYGIQANGNQFVFIVDSSTSMRFKFAEARRELQSAVRGLSPNQQFYVIFFDRDSERMRLGEWNESHTRYHMNARSEPNLVPASKENIAALIRWMQTIQLDSDTNPYTAVVFALRQLRPDAIFLLSDGEFHDGGTTEAFLLKENAADRAGRGTDRRTIVHCVGFYSRLGEITLKRIALANGGTYRFVEPPEGGMVPFVSPALGRRR